ncbi:hypothetical protein Q9R38_28295 [Priestia aryabhattai]|uniref:hypothetical protein n=1 Tax=Priestia aryabhattai TaxID=412384 RepID=UPI002880DB8A|nr:hypothetical protein [Priestia aryabhattai]MDT0150420.1 hypothetical protein [Priestia aryabhattai]MDT0155985.1 hypothetical protein [Priestia aryabhattai]
MTLDFIHLGFILLVLLLPFFIFINNHPIKVIRFISKVLISISIIMIIVIVPLYSAYSLGYKTLIIPAIPVLSRLVTWLMEKAKLFNTNYTQIIDKLLVLSAVAIGLGLLSVAYAQPLKPIMFTIIALTFLYFVDIRKYSLIGNLFGIILTVFSLKQSIDAIYTVVTLYILGMLLIRLMDKIFNFNEKSRASVERITLAVILLISYKLIIIGGIHLPSVGLLMKTIMFCSLILFYIGLNYFLEKIKFSIILRHYVPGSIPLIILLLMFFLINNSNIKLMYGQVFLMLTPIFLMLNLFRILSPLEQYFRESIGFDLKDLNQTFNFYLGKKLGSVFFNFLFGKEYHLIKSKFSFTALCLYGVVFYLIFRKILPEDGFESSSNYYLVFLSILSITSAFSFISSISDLDTQQTKEQGLEKSLAIKKSTSIMINYLFILIPIVLIVKSQLQNVGIIGLILMIIYLIFIIINTNIVFLMDLMLPNYNQLSYTRGYLSFAILTFSHITLLVTFFYYFNEKNLLEIQGKFISFFCYFSFVSFSIAKLIGYDKYTGSKKCRRQALWLFILLILGTVPSIILTPIILSFLIHSRLDIVKFTFLYELVLVIETVGFLALAIFPSTNDNFKGKYKDIIKQQKSKIKQDKERFQQLLK